MSWIFVKKSGIDATGGTITESGGYRYHTFTSSGTFSLSSGGEVDILVVGGGGGGNNQATGGGGGGGGGVGLYSGALSPDSYAVTVGNGAPANNSILLATIHGDGSSFGSLVTAGGGRSAPGIHGNSSHGADSGTPQSNAGGTQGSGYPSTGGGGGGAGGAGVAGGISTTTDPVGEGGAGYQWLNGLYYGGGGGGGSAVSNQNGSLGGVGGGGAGGKDGTAATSGTANTGGGGGGTRDAMPGAGGSGIVIIRYAI